MVKCDVDDGAKVEKRTSFNHRVRFTVKNTFINLEDDDDDDDLGIQLAGRQRSAPVQLIRPAIKTLEHEQFKGLYMEPIHSQMEDLLRDPEGPEPEPDVKAPEQPGMLGWRRAPPPAQWGPEACLPHPAAPCAGGAYAVLPNGGFDLMVPYPQAGQPAAGPPASSPTIAPKPDPSMVPKRRRRRAGASLIDIAKRHLQERLTLEGAQQPHGAAALLCAQAPLQCVQAASPSAPAAGRLCDGCHSTFPATHRFSHFCGLELQAAQ